MNTHSQRKLLTPRHVAKPVVPWKFLGLLLIVMAMYGYRIFYLALMGNPNF